MDLKIVLHLFFNLYFITCSRCISLCCWSELAGFVRFLRTFLKSTCLVSKKPRFFDKVFPLVKSWPVLRSKARKLNFGDWSSNSLEAPLDELLWFELLLPGLSLFWPNCANGWCCCWNKMCCWYKWCCCWKTLALFCKLIF